MADRTVPDLFTTRASCPGCGAGAFTQICSLPLHCGELADFLRGFYQGRLDPSVLRQAAYSVCECANCMLLFQQHILNDEGMRLLYSDWISAEASLRKRQTAKHKLFRKYAAEAEMISRLIDRAPHETSVVEFGMGWGYWCRMAMAFNYRVTGIELSPERVAHAASMGVASVPAIDHLPPASVHFIYANQVFEHLAEPQQTMRELSALLAEDGVMLIRVPNARHTASQLRSNGWQPELAAIHPLEHINAFTRSSLLRAARCARLRPASVPLRLGSRSLKHFWSSARREFNDRFREPHIYLVKA